MSNRSVIRNGTGKTCRRQRSLAGFSYAGREHGLPVFLFFYYIKCLLMRKVLNPDPNNDTVRIIVLVHICSGNASGWRHILPW